MLGAGIRPGTAQRRPNEPKPAADSKVRHLAAPVNIAHHSRKHRKQVQTMLCVIENMVGAQTYIIILRSAITTDAFW